MGSTATIAGSCCPSASATPQKPGAVPRGPIQYEEGEPGAQIGQ